MSLVAVTPVAGSPHRSPASLPALAAEVTYTPARVQLGVLDDAAQRAGADVPGRPLDNAQSGHDVFPSVSAARIVRTRPVMQKAIANVGGTMSAVNGGGRVSGTRPGATGRWLLVAEGEDRGLDAVLEAEFGEDAADVGLDRLLADRQVLGDLPVAVTLGDQPEHVALAG